MQDVKDPENIQVSVVIPCLNEEETLQNVLGRVSQALSELGVSSEIILADNGSHDQSVEIAKTYATRIVHVKEKGYGSALHAGINEAQGEYVIFGDADASYDFSYIPRFFALLEEGNDLVIGSRMTGVMEQGAMPLLHRYVGTPILTLLINSIYGLHISDSNSGMRGLRASAYKQLSLKSDGMEYVSEMLIRASFLRMKIAEFPMDFFKDKRSKPPHLRTWRDGMRNMIEILSHIPERLSLFLKNG